MQKLFDLSGEQVILSDGSLTLGLSVEEAISRSIIDGHGGRLWAESWPGVGSVFRFTLPTSDELAGSGR